MDFKLALKKIIGEIDHANLDDIQIVNYFHHENTVLVNYNIDTWVSIDNPRKESKRLTKKIFPTQLLEVLISM